MAPSDRSGVGVLSVDACVNKIIFINHFSICDVFILHAQINMTKT